MMNYCVRVTFSSQEEANLALNMLHQLKMDGCRLVVEYAPPWTAQHVSVVDRLPPFPSTTAPAPTSHLLYPYPPPNQTILTNIAHTLACVPELYMQVVHLMEKMNLPPPFAPLTPTPPLSQPEAVCTEPVKNKEDEEEESELESEEEQGVANEVVRVGKREIKSAKRRKVSFRQLKDQLHVPAAKVQKRTIAPTDLPSTDQLTSAAEPQTPDASSLTSQELAGEHSSLTDSTGNNLNSASETFITTAEILSHRITADEMRVHHLYKNYSRGKPSMRLYIKNLRKKVVEQDLRYLFGKYAVQKVDQYIFDIRLMPWGTRMSGRAFICLPSVKAAMKAVKEMNGYKLYGQPMVVKFARS